MKTDHDAPLQLGNLQLTDTAPNRIWSMCTGLEKTSGKYNINALNLSTIPKPEPTKKFADLNVFLCCV